jgi:hypothetical protein
MKKFVFLITIAAILGACGGSKSPMGTKVKEPFSGSKYESNNRWFRGVGKGDSADENIAKSKADMNAKKELAGQVETNVKQVADNYLSETGYGDKDEVTSRFQDLTRQVMNTTIADVRKIGEQKYWDGERYTVFIAYEIKKAAMFRFMKKQIKLDNKMNEATRKMIEEILDEEIKKLEALGD